MATIGEITQGSSYVGNPVLGGGVGIGVTIDPTPTARLAAFSYYRDQHLWEQKQKDDAVAAKQIADIAAYDITSPLTQYSNELKSKLDRIHKSLRENPNSLVYGRGPREYQELQEMVNDFERLRTTATASSTAYIARKNSIDAISDLGERDTRQKELDYDVKKLFDGGVDVNKTLRTARPLRQSDYKIPKIADQTIDYLYLGKNGVVNTKTVVSDWAKLNSDAQLIAAGAKTPVLDESSQEFQRLSEEEKEIERGLAKITSIQREKFARISANVSDFVKQYLEANKDATEEELIGAPTGSNSITDFIKSVNGINLQIRAHNELVKAGQVTDPSQKVVTQLWEEIKFKDGLSEAEVIVVNAVQESGGSLIKKVEKAYQQTDDEIQRRQLAIQQFNADSGRMQEDRLAKEQLSGGGGIGDESSLLYGNALNDIEIPDNYEPGIYVMGKGRNEQRLANIQRLLGTVKNKSGKDVPVLSKEQIDSEEEGKEVSYRVENINGKPFVTEVQVNNIWYDRGYFKNAQLNLDKEPKGGQKTSYKQFQQYRGGEQPKTQTKETDAEYYKRTGKFRQK